MGSHVSPAHPLHTLLLVCALIGAAAAQTCERCRAFQLKVTCSEEDDKVVSMYNGYKCAALSGSNVDLNCQLDDSTGLNITYEWYKSSTVGGVPFSESSDAVELTDCTASTCSLYDVSWSSETDIKAHDSFFYQCVVSVKDGDEAVGTFYSNAFKLDVQKYTPASEGDSDSHDVDIGTTEVKMSCDVPDTNPPSTAKWYYSADEDDDSPAALEISSNTMVVENTIVSTDSKYGYSRGMLIIMDFKATNAGTYSCKVNYTNKFGTSYEVAVSNHTVTSTGKTLSSTSQALRIVSQVSGPDFLFYDADQTTLECQPSNVDAGTTAQIYWQSTATVNGVTAYQNLTGTGWTYEDNNRVLKFSKTNSLEGVQFRCQVIRGTTEILLNGFHQSPILPKTGYIPPSMGCSTNGTTYTATIDNLMTSDITTTGTTQWMVGASYYWRKDNVGVNKFTSGYTVSSSTLSYVSTSDSYCTYIQHFKYYSNLYSIQEILPVTNLDEQFTTVPTATLTMSGGNTVTLTCTASLEEIPASVQNKVSLNALFDVGGCPEYAEALVSASDADGTCETEVSRWVKIDTKSLCRECIIKCAGATSCATSAEQTQEVEAKGESCSTNTGETSDEEGLASWAVGLLVVVVILVLLGTAAVFFHYTMEKNEKASTSTVTGAKVVKVDAEGKDGAATVSSPVIKMPKFTSGFGSFFTAESNDETAKPTAKA